MNRLLNALCRKKFVKKHRDFIATNLIDFKEIGLTRVYHMLTMFLLNGVKANHGGKRKICCA